MGIAVVRVVILIVVDFALPKCILVGGVGGASGLLLVVVVVEVKYWWW